MLAVPFLAVLVVAVIWKLYQISKAPSDGPLWCVTLCLVSIAASFLLAMPGGASAAETVASGSAAKVAQNVLLLAAMYFLMCFYLLSAGRAEGRRRARREGVLALTVAGAMTVSAATAPSGALTGSSQTADMTVAQVALFYLVAGLYFTYALLTASVWSRRYARMSQRPHSLGLWLVTAGMTGLALVCVVRAGVVVLQWQHGQAPGRSFSLAVALVVIMSSLLCAVGVTYPGARTRIAAGRLWLRRRRLHRRLEPLWVLLSAAYPEILPPQAPSWRERRRARGVHRRYHRRVVECRDGLVRISPHLSDQGGVDLEEMAPQVVADRLRAAARSARAGIPAPRQPVPLAVPKDDDHDADVQQLVVLADVLRAHPRPPKTTEATC